MPAWSVSIRTPIKDKRLTIRGPYRTEAEVKDFVEMQQLAILLKSGLPAFPRGEITEIRRAVYPDDFKKRPAAFAIQDSTSGPALCK
jgi:hypothetical protein